jgi:hypothetical protein
MLENGIRHLTTPVITTPRHYTMPERCLQPLMLAFTRLLDQQPLFSRTLGLV